MAAILAVIGAAIVPGIVNAEEPVYREELIFPPRAEHNHAPGIVECPNGDLLASWYRGSGERSADDVAVYGARCRKGGDRWSDAFLMADTPGFPDCNTTMYIDRQGKLWLFWPIILANSWESCLTQYRVSSDYSGDGSPHWEWQGSIFLRPEDFAKIMTEALEARLKTAGATLLEEAETKAKLELLRGKINDKLYSRLGWQPRCKPTVLPSGRILLPLYSDTYSAGIMAISDDEGKTWRASRPLAGFGSIQPTVLRRDGGTLVAYMRENGPIRRIRVSESKDDGLTWGPVEATDLPNPGAGIDGVRLTNGHWLLVYNDTTRGRNSLAVSLSEDEGRTWKWTRHLERHDKGSYHYPAMIQGRDGVIHCIYSYFVDTGKSMKHAAFDESWVRAGRPPIITPHPAVMVGSAARDSRNQLPQACPLSVPLPRGIVVRPGRAAAMGTEPEGKEDAHTVHSARFCRKWVCSPPAQVDEILDHQKETRQKFGQIAVRWGLVSTQQVWEAWARQMSSRRQYVEVNDVGIDTAAVARVTVTTARSLGIVPLRLWGDQLVVATPPDVSTTTLSDLAELTGCQVHACATFPEAVRYHLDHLEEELCASMTPMALLPTGV